MSVLQHPFKRDELLARLRHETWSAPAAGYRYTAVGPVLLLHTPHGCADWSDATPIDRPAADALPDTLVLAGCAACDTDQVVDAVRDTYLAAALLERSVENVVTAARERRNIWLRELRLLLDPTWAWSGSSLPISILADLAKTLGPGESHLGQTTAAAHHHAFTRWAWSWCAAQLHDHPDLDHRAPSHFDHRILVNRAFASHRDSRIPLALRQPVAAHAAPSGHTFAVFAVTAAELAALDDEVSPQWGSAEHFFHHETTPWAAPLGPRLEARTDLDAVARDPHVWRVVLTALEAAHFPRGALSDLIAAALGVLTPAGGTWMPEPASPVGTLPSLVGPRVSPF